MENQKFYYDNKIVKLFSLATIIWGVVGVLVGVVIALQLAFPFFNFGQTPCENGFALNYPCNGFDLQSHISLEEMDASEGRQA